VTHDCCRMRTNMDPAGLDGGNSGGGIGINYINGTKQRLEVNQMIANDDSKHTGSR
jgi:hypothetical protein